MTTDTIPLDQEAMRHAQLVSEIYAVLAANGIEQDQYYLRRIVCILAQPIWLRVWKLAARSMVKALLVRS